MTVPNVKIVFENSQHEEETPANIGNSYIIGKLTANGTDYYAVKSVDSVSNKTYNFNCTKFRASL